MERSFSRRSLGLYFGTITFQHFLFLLMIFFYLFKSSSIMYSSHKNVNNNTAPFNHDFVISSNWFYKSFILLNLDNWSVIIFDNKDELQIGFVSNNLTLQLKIAKKKKYLESLLISNLTSLHILLALPKRQI